MKNIDKAKEIASKYDQLKYCCEVLSDVNKEDAPPGPMNIEGWRTWASTIKSAGINIDEIYQHIEKLALERKEQLESELAEIR